MKKAHTTDRNAGNFPSPRTSNYHNTGAAILPLNNKSTGLPSKWEDAERWIFSPVSGNGGGKVSLRRPKSKSGPMGRPGIKSHHSVYSLPCDNLEPCIARSVSVHCCTHLVCPQKSLTCSQDERVDDTKIPVNTASRSVSRRDIATQMSPERSCNSSPRSSSFSESNSSNLPTEELQGMNTFKPVVRDVQIDERVTLTQWLIKHKGHNSSKGSENVDEWKLKAVDRGSTAGEVPETEKSLSKARRDEAKITAWENLQKEKAEADIRKLEMKLEKKRSTSMNKIMKKLRSAKKKAQEMRNAMSNNQELQVSETSNNPMFPFGIRQMGSLGGCFTCHAHAF